MPIKLDFRSRHGGKGDRDSDDEPRGAEAAPEGLQAPKPKPAPKPRKPAKKKKGEKSELWDV